MKNLIMAAVLGLFLVGSVPAEASAMTDLVLSTGNAEVHAVEVMHYPPHHRGRVMPPHRPPHHGGHYPGRYR